MSLEIKIPFREILVFLFIINSFTSLFTLSFTSVKAQALPTPASEPLRVSVTIPATIGSIIFAGYTSPNAFVAITVDSNITATTIACPGGNPSICQDPTDNGYFEETISGLTAGVYEFGIYSVDNTVSPGNLSTPTIIRTIPIFQGLPVSTDVITLPPTIAVDKINMLRPERQIIRGQGKPDSNIRGIFNFTNPSSYDVFSENDGTWEIENPEVLSLGQNHVYSVVQGGTGAISEFSKIIGFNVLMSADLNLDTEIDILDFSVLMFNYGSTTPDDWAADINDDTLIDLSDFSIMMFNWTGEI